MAGDKIKNANDKGKNSATSEQKPFDLVRAAAKEQEKLSLIQHVVSCQGE